MSRGTLEYSKQHIGTSMFGVGGDAFSMSLWTVLKWSLIGSCFAIWAVFSWGIADSLSWLVRDSGVSPSTYEVVTVLVSLILDGHASISQGKVTAVVYDPSISGVLWFACFLTVGVVVLLRLVGNSGHDSEPRQA